MDYVDLIIVGLSDNNNPIISFIDKLGHRLTYELEFYKSSIGDFPPCWFTKAKRKRSVSFRWIATYQVTKYYIIDEEDEFISYTPFEESDRILSKLEKELVKINDSLNSKKDRRATTFLCGIVGKKETIVASIGDSRAYITKNNELQQVSRDDSLVQEYYENGYIRTKDDMRFHYKSNHITNCLGANDDFSLNYYVLDNSQYDTLILVSDGVSDCLSDSQIMAITAQTPKEEIANALVMAANRTNSHRQKQSYETYYYEDIYGGKDNTTAAIYHNRK